MAFAIPSRAKFAQRARNAGDRRRRRRAVSVGASSGRADFRRHDRGRRRRHRRPAARGAPARDPDRAGAARHFAGLGGVAAADPACRRLSLHHRPLALATFCSTFGSSLYLEHVHGWDRTSAFLAGSPGALSQITILAVEKGADLSAIALVQTVRVIILTAALPLLLAMTGIAPSSSPALGDAVASPLELAELLGGGAGGGAAVAADKVSGELDVRRDDRLQRAARHRNGRRRPAALGAGRGAGRHRLPDRRAFCADEGQVLFGHVHAALGSFAIAIVDFRDLRRGDRAHHPMCGFPTSSSPSRRARWTPCWRWR